MNQHFYFGSRMQDSASFVVNEKLPAHLLFGGLIIALMISTVVAATEDSSDSVTPNSINPGSTIQVEYQDGLLTLRTMNAPLVKIIEAIGKETGYQTLVFGEVESKLTRSFEAAPLEQVLRQLLEGVSNAMRFDDSQTPRLTQVLLYGSGTSDTAYEFLPSAGPANALISQALDSEKASDIEAIRARAFAGDPEAAIELASLLREDPDPAVRGEVAAILGEIGDAVAVTALETGVRDKDRQVRFRSIRSLATISSGQSTQVLAETMLNHTDRRTRLLAVWGLGKQSGPLAISYLEAALSDDDELIRQSVNRALKESGAEIPVN